MKTVIVVLVLLLVAVGVFANTAQDEFRAGFIEGYKSIMGNWAYVPACPWAPATPWGSTPYREGIKAGILQALRDKGVKP